MFDVDPNDVYWCTADIGWVTGHSYIVFGPLCAGSTSVMYEGAPNYPDLGRWWDIIEKYGVNVFCTTPPPSACSGRPAKSGWRSPT